MIHSISPIESLLIVILSSAVEVANLLFNCVPKENLPQCIHISQWLGTPLQAIAFELSV